MRPFSLVFASTLLSMACGSSAGSTSPTTTTRGGSTGTSALTVRVDSGLSARTAVVGPAVPARIHVTIAGQPALNVAVTWSVTAGAGSVSPATSTTDATGAAS